MIQFITICNLKLIEPIQIEIFKVIFITLIIKNEN